MEGIAPPTKERYLEALNTARCRYDQALIGEDLRGQDRWLLLDEMERAMQQARQALERQGVTTSYSLAKGRYELEESHAGTGK